MDKGQREGVTDAGCTMDLIAIDARGCKEKRGGLGQPGGGEKVHAAARSAALVTAAHDSCLEAKFGTAGVLGDEQSEGVRVDRRVIVSLGDPESGESFPRSDPCLPCPEADPSP